MAWAVSIVKIYAGNAWIGISKPVSTIAMTDKVALRHSPIPALNPAWRACYTDVCPSGRRGPV